MAIRSSGPLLRAFEAALEVTGDGRWWMPGSPSSVW
jgi:hypothetical protein